MKNIIFLVFYFILSNLSLVRKENKKTNKKPLLKVEYNIFGIMNNKKYVLPVIDNKLHYIAVRPSASISQLRQKVWHLLDLPDYCEEIIILKSEDNKELPLTHLRQGNDPQHPYYLEVYLPENHASTVSLFNNNNMITMDDNKIEEENLALIDTVYEEKVNREYIGKRTDIENSTYTAMTNEKMIRSKITPVNNNDFKQNSNYKKSELSCKMSSSSIFFKIHGRKSRDNFANILLKIQSDLSTLNNKLSDLENRIQV